MDSYVVDAYGNGVRGIMKGMGGKSGPVRSHKATPEELAELRHKVAEHEKVWGRPKQVTRLDRMLSQPGRRPRICKKDMIRAMMREHKLSIEQIAEKADTSVRYVMDIAYSDKEWRYLSPGSEMRKLWEAEEKARGRKA